MKLSAILIGWTLLLGIALVFLSATVEDRPMTVCEKVSVLYWPREDVREVCHGRDSCYDGGRKFRFFSAPDLRKSLKNPIADNPQQEMQ